jgi:hypothetical protein
VLDLFEDVIARVMIFWVAVIGGVLFGLGLLTGWLIFG